MATTSYRANVGLNASADYSSTAQIDLLTESQNFVGAEGATIYCFSTQDGTMDVNYIDLNGNSRSLQTETVTASTLKVLDIGFRVPSFEVKFTPDAATPGTVTVEAYTY
tara:strand:+ start:6709 stop:7035 length:327 start_codon:yes stop_codon:yes gene_type:complete